MPGALPSGTFASPFAGRLKVELSAQFFASNYTVAGFPNTSAQGSNLALRGFVGPVATRRYLPIMDKYIGTVAIELDYPGGNVSWPVGVEDTAHVSPTTGFWSYGFNGLELTCTLEKK